MKFESGIRQHLLHSGKLAGGALLSALDWLFLILSVWLPSARQFFMLAAVLCLMLAAEKVGRRWALAVYLLSLLFSALYPGFLQVLPYTFFMAPYILLGYCLSPRIKGKRAVMMRVLLGSLLWIFFILIGAKAAFFEASPLRGWFSAHRVTYVLFAPVIVYLYDLLLSGMDAFYRRYLKDALRSF